MSGSSLARTSAVMALGTVVSRLLGFGRASVLTWVIGIGLVGDTFDVANTLPNQFYLLLAGGMLNAVLVPQITKATAREDGGEAFVNRLLTLSFALIAAATAVVTALAPLLVRLYSQGWDAQTLALGTAFAFICLPQVLFYGLYTLLGQVLNARGRFAAYMWAPAVANLVAIAGLLLFRVVFPSRPPVPQWTAPMVWLLAGTASLGVALQAAVLVVPLRRSGFRYRPVWGWRGAGLGSASRVALWTFAAVAVSQLGFVVTSKVLTRANTLMAEQGVVGAGKAAYAVAFLLFMLPHSLVTVSLVTALFTRMSRAAHAGRRDEVVQDLSRGLRLPAVVLLPGTVAAAVLGGPAVRVLFPGNSAAETGAIAAVMVAMMLGVLPYGWLYLVHRVYYAFENARTPFYLQLVVTGVATGVNLLAALVDPRASAVVIGLGQTLSNVVAAVLGLALLRRLLGPLSLGGTVRLYLRLGLASLAGGAAALGVAAALAGVLPHDDTGSLTRLGSAVQLAAGLAALGLVVLGVAHLLRVQEVAQLLGPVLRRARPGRATGGAP